MSITGRFERDDPPRALDFDDGPDPVREARNRMADWSKPELIERIEVLEVALDHSRQREWLWDRLLRAYRGEIERLGGSVHAIRGLFDVRDPETKKAPE